MRIALVGYGRMGREVEAAARDQDVEVVARIDPGGAPGTRPWPGDDAADAGVERNREALGGADVVVEFTEPDAVVPNVIRVVSTGTPVVVGTTGWTHRLPEIRERVDAAGTGLIWAPNFALDVQVFLRAVRALARLAEALPDHDVAVHETHHRHKLDHPSGTARHMAGILVDELSRKTGWAAGLPSGEPDPTSLRVTSARVGQVPGTHVVRVDGPDGGIELRHEARSRRGFARGALAAARWIRGREGVFHIDDLLAQRLDRSTATS